VIKNGEWVCHYSFPKPVCSETYVDYSYKETDDPCDPLIYVKIVPKRNANSVNIN
jgi:hypothetical protein